MINWKGDVHIEAIRQVEVLIGDHAYGGITDGYTYDHQRLHAESFMLAGGGPSAWAWFVFREDATIDHSYVEYVNSQGTALIPIPRHLEDALLIELRADATAQER